MSIRRFSTPSPRAREARAHRATLGTCNAARGPDPQARARTWRGGYPSTWVPRHTKCGGGVQSSVVGDEISLVQPFSLEPSSRDTARRDRVCSSSCWRSILDSIHGLDPTAHSELRIRYHKWCIESVMYSNVFVTPQRPFSCGGSSIYTTITYRTQSCSLVAQSDTPHGHVQPMPIPSA